MDRLGVEDYYQAAYDVLGESGSETLTIAVLCERLGVTKGSFYHHFGSLGGFVDALLTSWESEQGDQLTVTAKAQPDAALRLRTVIDNAVALPHASEAAIRAWARSNPQVAEVAQRVDKKREKALADAIVALGVDRTTGRLLGRMGMSLLVGTEQREQPVNTKQLRALFDEFQRLVGLEADPKLAAQLSKAR